MAMIKCPECSHDISDKAKSCPHCGFPLEDQAAPQQEQAAPQPEQAAPAAQQVQVAPQPEQAAPAAQQVQAAPQQAAAPNYIPEVPPPEVNWKRVPVYLCMIGLSAWLILHFIPDRDPANAGLDERAIAALKGDSKYFKPGVIKVLYVIAAVVGIAGIVDLVGRGIEKKGKLGFCRNCNMKVVALRRRRPKGWNCERCGNDM